MDKRDVKDVHVRKGQSCLISLPQLLEGGNKDVGKLNRLDLNFQKASSTKAVRILSHHGLQKVSFVI